MHVSSILGPVNLCKIFQRISEVWEDAFKTSNKSPATSQFLDLLHSMVFELFFYSSDLVVQKIDEKYACIDDAERYESTISQNYSRG